MNKALDMFGFMYSYQKIVEPTKVFYLCNIELKFISWKTWTV